MRPTLTDSCLPDCVTLIVVLENVPQLSLKFDSPTLTLNAHSQLPVALAGRDALIVVAAARAGGGVRLVRVAAKGSRAGGQARRPPLTSVVKTHVLAVCLLRSV